MYTGSRITRLSNSHQGSLRIGGRFEFNGYPIHHLVQPKIELHTHGFILKRDLKVALTRKKQGMRDLCRVLNCERMAIDMALRQPLRYWRIATYLRQFIAEAKQA